MDKRKTFFLAAIVLSVVIAASGCLNPPPKQAAGPGLTITNFISDTQEIDANEETNVEVDFDNIGDEVARDVQGELIRKGAFEVTPLGPVDEGNANLQKLSADLEPPITDTPSGDAFLWQIKAPAVTQQRTEQVQARVFYKYKTQGFGTIHFVPRDIIREKGESSFQLGPSSSAGPLEINVVATQPVILREEKPQNVSLRVTIDILNLVDGRVDSDAITPPGSCTKALDCIDSVEIQGFGAACLNATSEKTLWKPSDLKPIYLKLDGVRLVEGTEGKITQVMPFYINDASAATSCQIKVTANYRYRVDSPVLDITVNPIT